jgi:hypothetical protein
MNLGAVLLLDQRSQLSRIKVGILFLFLESKREHLVPEFDKALAASLAGPKGQESLLAEGVLDLIETFPTETELTTRLGNRVSIDRMGAYGKRQLRRFPELVGRRIERAAHNGPQGPHGFYGRRTNA